ncbi:MAG: SDR family NAD(P)-dependent oxidoreductase, partial [Burkholderiales bacterium]
MVPVSSILSSPRIALVTGGTDGLGLELVRKLEARGDRVLVVARHQRDLASVAPSARFIAADAGDPDFARIVVAALDHAGVERIDLIIHNAADGWYGAPADMPPGRAESMLAVNTWAPLALTHRLASRM